MESIDGAIEAKEIDLGELTKLRVILKSFDGKLYIDCRKWVKFANLDHFVSTKKGIMLNLRAWKDILPLIQAMLEDYKDELKKAA